MKIFKLMIAAVLLLMPTMASAEITVEDAWVRMPPPVADTAAGYMVIKNSGNADVEITGVESAAATSPEFHSMTMHDGMMHMQKMEKVVVPAHGEITFSSGGNHLMLIGLTKTLNAGDHVMITIKTAGGESVMVHAQVRDMRAAPASEHSGHSMGDMEDGDVGHGDMDHGH